VQQEKDERALQFTKKGVPEFANISNIAPLWTQKYRKNTQGAPLRDPYWRIRNRVLERTLASAIDRSEKSMMPLRNIKMSRT